MVTLLPATFTPEPLQFITELSLTMEFLATEIAAPLEFILESEMIFSLTMELVVA